MRVLVTNDDGVLEPGLLALAAPFVEAGHEVLAVAPASQQSGSGTSLGVVVDAATVALRPVALPGLDTVTAFAVEAPPSLLVRAACTGAFGPAPDLVVSGINPGFNVGRLFVHSGTVGAATTAATFGVSGVAVSTAALSDTGFRSAAQVALWATEAVTALGVHGIVLNVNVPDRPLSELRGVEVGAMVADSIVDVSFVRAGATLVVRRSTREPPFPPGTDSAHLSDGSVSVSTVPLPWSSWDPSEVVAHVRRALAEEHGRQPQHDARP